MATTKAEAPEPQMDWQQVALNGGPPCFALLDDEDHWYCGRAERWDGHDGDHVFVPLETLLKNTRAIDLAPAGEKCVKCGHNNVRCVEQVLGGERMAFSTEPNRCGCKCEFAPAGELVSREAAIKIAQGYADIVATETMPTLRAQRNTAEGIADDLRALPPVARVPDGHFDPAPHTEASRNDPEELLCVACGKPVWAHSCNRHPLAVARVPATNLDSIESLVERVTSPIRNLGLQDKIVDEVKHRVRVSLTAYAEVARVPVAARAAAEEIRKLMIEYYSLGHRDMVPNLPTVEGIETIISKHCVSGNAAEQEKPDAES